MTVSFDIIPNLPWGWTPQQAAGNYQVKETTERFIDRWVTVQGILTGTHRFLPLETLVLTPDEIENRIAIGDQFIADILEKGEVLYAG